MNDRCVSLLENYEITVLRTYKGRGAVLCESDLGLLTFKEYTGYQEKCEFQDALLHRIRENGFMQVEMLIRNKEGQLLTEDLDGSNYLLKTCIEGRECSLSDPSECSLAMQTLAELHKASIYDETLPMIKAGAGTAIEFEKHNRELKKIQRFLKGKGQKSDFEVDLVHHLNYFLCRAEQVTKQWEKLSETVQRKPAVVCHGDYQHHNLIFSGNTLYVLNFEKCLPDSPIRDIYLFLRKLLEKSEWSVDAGFELLRAYEENNALCREDYLELYYKLAYPDKFWKIANFYYNSPKSWIPEKNQEKLNKVCIQEEQKDEFLTAFQKKYGII